MNLLSILRRALQLPLQLLGAARSVALPPRPALAFARARRAVRPRAR